MSNENMDSLQQKLNAFRDRRELLQKEQIRLDANLKSSSAREEESRIKLLKITNTKTVDAAKAKLAKIYVRIEEGVNAIDKKMVALSE